MGDMTVEQIKEEIVSYLADLYYTGLPGSADAILDIGGIGDLLKLRDEGKLAEILDDQEWPTTPYKQWHRLKRREFDFSAAVNEGYSRSKAMALKAGFLRIKRLASSGAEEKDDER